MKKVNNTVAFLIIALTLIIILLVAYIIFYEPGIRLKSENVQQGDGLADTIRIVIKADEERNCLETLVISQYNPEPSEEKIYGLVELDLSYSKDKASKFKFGQEVEYDKLKKDDPKPRHIYTSKVKVTKEKTDIFIPKEFIRYCYSSVDKVNVTVNEITPNSITLTVTDTNEYPYYNISKPFFVIERLEDSSYKALTRKSYSFSSTIEPLVYNIPNMTEDDKYTVTGWKIDWTEEYGTLEEGNYQISLPEPLDSVYPPKRVEIKINFSVNAKGEVTYEEPVIE